MRLRDLLASHVDGNGIPAIGSEASRARIRRRETRDGEIEPHIGEHSIRRAALALRVPETQIVLGLGITLIGGETIPLRRLGVVLRHT